MWLLLSGGFKQSGFGKDLGMNTPYLSTAHHKKPTSCFVQHLYVAVKAFLHGIDFSFNVKHFLKLLFLIFGV